MTTDRHPATVLACDHIDEGKSEAGASLSCHSRLVDTLKALEQMREHFGIDALSLVRYTTVNLTLFECYAQCHNSTG